MKWQYWLVFSWYAVVLISQWRIKHTQQHMKLESATMSVIVQLERRKTTMKVGISLETVQMKSCVWKKKKTKRRYGWVWGNEEVKVYRSLIKHSVAVNEEFTKGKSGTMDGVDLLRLWNPSLPAACCSSDCYWALEAWPSRMEAHHQLTPHRERS